MFISFPSSRACPHHHLFHVGGRGVIATSVIADSHRSMHHTVGDLVKSSTFGLQYRLQTPEWTLTLWIIHCSLPKDVNLEWIPLCLSLLSLEPYGNYTHRASFAMDLSGLPTIEDLLLSIQDTHSMVLLRISTRPGLFVAVVSIRLCLSVVSHTASGPLRGLVLALVAC